MGPITQASKKMGWCIEEEKRLRKVEKDAYSWRLLAKVKDGVVVSALCRSVVRLGDRWCSVKRLVIEALKMKVGV